MAAERDVRQFNAVGLEVAQVADRIVLLPEHELAREGQRQEIVHQVRGVRERDHGLEDPAHRTGTELVSDADGIERAGGVRRGPAAHNKALEEFPRPRACNGRSGG